MERTKTKRKAVKDKKVFLDRVMTNPEGYGTMCLRIGAAIALVLLSIGFCAAMFMGKINLASGASFTGIFGLFLRWMMKF